MKSSILTGNVKALTLALTGLSAAVASAQLTNYWPVTESSGTTTINAAGGTNGTLFNGAGFVNDAQRGQVLNLPGAGGYVNAGFLPVLPLNGNFTWSFWMNSSQGANTNVMVGNRYSGTTGVDFAPREFIKFTNNGFEWHVNGGGQNVDTADIAAAGWNHLAVVKQGSMLLSYRNGLIDGFNRVTAAPNNAQPLYFGGDQANESWAGRLDDIGTWTSALPSSSIAGMAKGTYNPATAPLAAAGSLSTVSSSNFTGGLAGFTSTTRGLESTDASGYNAPSGAGGQVTLGGTTTSQYWRGSSIESVATYDASKTTEVSVDRVSISGTGSAFRSSLWVMGDDAHYMHFSQNVNEGGWTFNARDDGGNVMGAGDATGVGINMPSVDGLDADLGLHNMKIRLEPTGTAGDVNMLLYLDGNLIGARGFSNFPANFRVILTGQARATGDSVNAVFDNLLIAQVPEPGSALLLLGGLGLLARRRR